MSQTISPSRWAAFLSPRYYLIYVVGLIGIFYVFKEALPYRIFAEDIYGSYWSVRWWLVGHIGGGAVALLIGPSQFITEIRDRNLRLHRFLGKVYIISILIGSLSAFMMAFTVSGRVNFSWAFGLVGLGMAWLTTVLMAYRMIRLKRIQQHREWMIRSYVVTFGFVLFRVLENWSVVESIMPEFSERGPTVVWACWAIPLFIAEVVLSWNKKK